MTKRTADGKFARGSSGNRRGRPKGAANKVTQEIRELLRQALDEEGGVKYLRWAARKHPQAFLALVGRLLPAEIRASLEHEIVPTVVIKDYTGRELGIEPRPEPERLAIDAEASEVGSEAAIGERGKSGGSRRRSGSRWSYDLAGTLGT